MQDRRKYNNVSMTRNNSEHNKQSTFLFLKGLFISIFLAITTIIVTFAIIITVIPSAQNSEAGGWFAILAIPFIIVGFFIFQIIVTFSLKNEIVTAGIWSFYPLFYVLYLWVVFW